MHRLPLIALSLVFVFSSVISLTKFNTASAWSASELPTCTGITFNETAVSNINAVITSGEGVTEENSFLVGKRTGENTSGYFVYIHPSPNEELTLYTPSADWHILKVKSSGASPYNRKVPMNADGTVLGSPSSASNQDLYDFSCISYAQNVEFAENYTGFEYDRPYYTPPPPDLCPNIEGTQETVPEGYEVDGEGDCVLIPEPPPEPPPSTSDVITFQQKSGLVLAAMAGISVIHQCRYRGQD